MDTRRKYLVATLALVLSLSTLLSALFIAERMEHDCPGEHCAICTLVKVSQQVLSSHPTPPPPAIALFVATVSYGLVNLFARELCLPAQTPVSLCDQLVI